MPVGQMPLGEQLSMEHNTRQTHKGGPPWMCSQHVRASAGDNAGQNTDKAHTPNPRLGIKIPDPAGNWTRATGLEGMDSTDHATAMDSRCLLCTNFYTFCFTIDRYIGQVFIFTPYVKGNACVILLFCRVVLVFPYAFS